MLTINTIIKEIKDVPVNRLEELYQYIKSLTIKSKPSKTDQEKILSFGGAFKEMSDQSYKEFLDHTKETRNNLFGRNIDL